MEPIRIGIIGTRRGMGFISLFSELEGCRVTAVCENNPHQLEHVRSSLPEGMRIFDDYDAFLDSGLFDAVMLCNYFFEHTPFAVKAMRRGIHVLSECTPALTLAECVQLCETVEQTGCHYMLAENYPYFACNMEMRRRFATGRFGRALYCEGEYNHPVTPHDKNMLAPGRLHWRNWLPRTYYLTHSLSPLMAITGATPVAVNCKCVFAPDNLKGTACQVGDLAAVMLCEMDDGSLCRITGCAAWGGHGNWYRICGEKGNMENVRGSLDQVRVQYDSWHVPEGEQEIAVHPARWEDDETLNALAAKAGHAGGDFWVAYHFRQVLRGLEQPLFDVYRCVAMSATAVLALRSAQNGGREFRLPNFRDPVDRARVAGDTDSPMPDAEGRVTMPCCSRPDYRPTAEDLAQAEREWREAGLI